MSPFAWQSNKAILFYLKYGRSIQILANWAVIKDKAYLEVVFKKKCCCLVAQSCPTFCDPMVCSMPGFPVFHCPLEFAHTHVH